MIRELPANITILKGHHADCKGTDGCVMDIVSYVCGYNTITDQPSCACPVLTRFAIRLNDFIQDTELRTRLLTPLISSLAGSKSTPEVEQRRMFYFADRAVRLFAPLALDARGYAEQASSLRALPEIVTRDTALQGKATATAAYAADAAAAYAAAAAAAYAADADAAYAAAAYAADAAADAAAAAAYAAADAAYAAANIYSQAAQVLHTACLIK